VAQCGKLGIPYEILVQEDGSKLHLAENALTAKLPGVIYTPYTANAGRAAIRNRLADAARYEQLLFLDCDSQILHDGFIGKYLQNSDCDLVYGGTTYQKPQLDSLMLHYLYGSTREALPTSQRLKNPVASFRTNNFMVRKRVFDKVRFDESLKQYGHEDTLFSLALANAGFTINHIENPVLHSGLEEASEFLNKTHMALENGWQLVQSGAMPSSAIRVIDGYLKLMSIPSVAWLLQRLYRYEKSLINNLSSHGPDLKRFDLLRIIWLHRMDRRSGN
jgi:glycosyltransferase involved in cell wall biosynthesis